MDTTGRPAAELSDEELEQQGTHAHATRNWVFLHGTSVQFSHHTRRMLELEDEYVRRHPKRTWQGTAGDGEAGQVDEASRLRAVLRSLASQVEAVLALPSDTPPAGLPPQQPADRAFLRRVAEAGGRMHKLEAHQAAREVGLDRAALARLYTQAPALLRTEGNERVLTDDGRSWLAAAR